MKDVDNALINHGDVERYELPKIDDEAEVNGAKSMKDDVFWSKEHNEFRPKMSSPWVRFKKDEGSHYRYEYKGVKLDPFRIAKIYGMTDFAMMTVLKKILCAGNRGQKDQKQDIKDCINALQRKLEMMNEDAPK